VKALLLTALLVFGSASVTAADFHPKYGPNAVPLSDGTNQSYFKTQKAPDFWALISFYVPQENDSSCSAAALTVVLNGARRTQQLSADDELVTHKSLTEKDTDEKYKAEVSGDMKLAVAHGTSLGTSVDRVAEVLKEAADKLKILTPTSEVQLIHIDLNDLSASRKKFHEYLVQNEKSANDFMILNFTQGMLTGDPEGMVGHLAAVGAYDVKHRLVLILDPDRQWYGPYWSPEDKVFDAIADKRSSVKPPQHPGYIYFKIK
jgi:hypothetical protein